MKEMLQQYKACMTGRWLVVDFLAIFFGMGAWVGVNGMFVQLPLLVKTAPESWSLPSYMSIAVQIANLGPISYAIFRKFYSKRLNDSYWIYSILLIGIVSSILLSFFYNYVTVVNGEESSVIFLILVFFTAIVGCTSSVLFFPYMRYYKEMYLISYLIGEGLSGFVPSILALAQGIGGNPECSDDQPLYKEPAFSTRVFFLIISVIMLLSFTAFALLNNLTACKNERISANNSIANPTRREYSLKPQHNIDLEDIKDTDKYLDNHSISTVVSNDHVKGLSRLRSTNLLLLMAVVSAFGNGVFPSIQSFSCLPYGNTAYHLAVTLGSMANPFACFLAVFLPHTSNRSISILASLCSVFIAYVLATSVLSPTPPLVDTVGGIVIIVSIKKPNSKNIIKNILFS